MENGDNWTWSKPGLIGSDFVLSRNGASIASVEFKGVMNGVVRVTGDGFEWTIERSGVLHPVVTVRESGSATALAVARPRIGGSYDVEVEGGFAARFRSISTWRAQFGWVKTDGAPMIVYTARSWSAHRTIEVRDASAITDETLLRLLMVLGGRFMAIKKSDVALTSAAIAAATMTVS